ncbi:flagellar type III secretion system pore protein FliP [Novosphingobium mangrovi (ex Hu et al. 2023)]|uniref:Flagellar biosynthetic protein FliP n=1 Tax=Novosphingobium mangrovi (ex Hu et al. 2023) TaxID=2930094 RepID=A0ABT0AGF1_9SPHN|nr:flagellar type III secretion system pore protein FliP [Novosphingobium mangrovi (ex Hu et al. 2023)]MCJ1962254.1 flagellar type III secretion system pore protein FliP [Novosphingobium mangrovi (ex Hu et al. 2023)]
MRRPFALALAGAILAVTLLPTLAHAQEAIPGALDRAFEQIGGTGDGPGGPGMSMSLQLLLIMGLLTILPSLVLMMTSFTRILVVLAILRQAIGLQQSPPNQVLIGLAMFLSLFVMAPTLDRVNETAIAPYAADQINAQEAIANAGTEFHAFMVRQTRERDLTMFAEMANAPQFASSREVPFSILLPAFVTSELKTAFQIGFMLFLPFLVIDLVISSVLMSLGMMMMSPMVVSMPFKLLLFVLVDGWALMMGSLAASFA